MEDTFLSRFRAPHYCPVCTGTDTEMYRVNSTHVRRGDDCRETTRTQYFRCVCGHHWKRISVLSTTLVYAPDETDVKAGRL